MATTVNASNTPIKVSTSIGSTRVVSSTTTQSATATATEIGDLTGIDVSGKQNGYTLVYDSSSGNWQAKPASSVAASVTSIDGGTF
tara:strand:+ start:1417 stop:1674 length:258 start_codon:yes stop_codon:yes gene_type:complete